MTERSHVYNGRFLQNLDLWTATNASYSAGDGDDHYGVAALSVGGYIIQDFTVPLARSYSLHVAVKPVGAVLTTNQVQAIITDAMIFSNNFFIIRLFPLHCACPYSFNVLFEMLPKSE